MSRAQRRQGTHGVWDLNLGENLYVYVVSRVLTFLDLGGNSIGDVGAEALAGALRVNGVLTHLDLEFNNINQKGKSQMREAVQGRKGFNLEI